MSNALLPNVPGTYILILNNRKGDRLNVGSLGAVSLPRGWYAYVGSALGPGGLAARIGRHMRNKKSRRWHLDHITARIPVSKIWYTTWPGRQECVWAGRLSEMGGVVPVPGFGASDCRCPAHLFLFPRCPGLKRFRALCRRQYPVRVICSA